MALEDILSALAVLIEQERESVWAQADLCAAAPPGAEGKLAEVAGRSRSWVRGLSRTARAFVGERRYPDIPFSLFAIAASSRKALELFDGAVTEGWSVRQYRDAIRGVMPEKARCPACGKVI